MKPVEIVLTSGGSGEGEYGGDKLNVSKVRCKHIYKYSNAFPCSTINMLIYFSK
jgi:hypothetical protein